ncbi:hypothetical protein ABID30_001723 [Enterococcus rotai]|uniref:Bacterial EndoU nuclease domain-containing protein n=1 Tax=Enterococcus rotai TaxID=118060 RepID=A0A0U2VWT2_9ENTE|nr:hypothetical protein [Enterococcus rotai]ALS37732.1 hypothetical protein ATZ35_11390 [Enterococcus rotai]
MAFVIHIPRVPVVPPVTMIPKPDLDNGNFSFPSLPKVPSAQDLANGIVGWFIGDYIQKIAKDANKNTSIKPEAKYKGSKKHGVNWKEGPATAKSEGTPQGQWSNKDLDYASELAKKLGARESGYFDLPPGSSSVVHKPDGSTVPAKRIWIRNNGTGTFHGYPSE